MQDRKTGGYIINPEFDRIEQTVEPFKEKDGIDHFRNPTLPKILGAVLDNQEYSKVIKIFL